MNKRIVTGEYNQLGYVLITPHNLRELYRAYNHPHDSGQMLSLNDPLALKIGCIRKMCIRTGREMSAELGYKWGGAERMDEEE